MNPPTPTRVTARAVCGRAVPGAWCGREGRGQGRSEPRHRPPRDDVSKGFPRCTDRIWKGCRRSRSACSRSSSTRAKPRPSSHPRRAGATKSRPSSAPWSEPSQLLTDVSPAFEITSGAGGGACPSGGTPPFAPSVTAGTENNDAGSYSPLDIRIARNDGEQEITGFASLLPPGLTGNLSGIPFCSEADIALARGKPVTKRKPTPRVPSRAKSGIASLTPVSGRFSRRPPASSTSGVRSQAPRSQSCRLPARMSARLTSAPSSCISRWTSTRKRRRSASPPVPRIRSRTSSKASSSTSAKSACS